MALPIRVTPQRVHRHSLSGWPAAVVVGEDRLSIEQTLRRARQLFPGPGLVLHVVIRRPCPGPGVLISPEVSWWKLDEAVRVLHGARRGGMRIPAPRVVAGEDLLSCLTNLVDTVDAATVVLPRPTGLCAVLTRRWWWAQTRQLLQQWPERRLVTLADAHALMQASADTTLGKSAGEPPVGIGLPDGKSGRRVFP